METEQVLKALLHDAAASKIWSISQYGEPRTAKSVQAPCEGTHKELVTGPSCDRNPTDSRDEVDDFFFRCTSGQVSPTSSQAKSTSLSAT